MLGHWESVAAVSLNDTILASAGSSWEDWGPINPDWRDSGLRAEMADRIQAVVREHVALGPLFALKDPRLCRLADLWLDGMDAVGVEPRVILMLRNPAEVMRSLENRDLMAPGYGQLLWLRHVLDAEYFSRARKRVVCRYDQLMRNWQGTVGRIKSGIGVALPRNSPAVHAEIEQFLSAEQRHHDLGAASVLDDPTLSDWLRRTFAILFRWSEQGEDPADHVELDAVRQAFDHAYSTFARLLLSADIAGDVGSGSRLKHDLNEQLAAAHRMRDVAQTRMQEAEAQQSALSAREVELAAQLESGAARVRELEGELGGLRAEAERLGQEAAEAEVLRAREVELAAQLESGAARVRELEGELGGLRAEAERLGQEAAEAEVLRAREAELAAQLVSGTTRLRELEEEIAELRTQAEQLHARVFEQEQELATSQEALRAAISDAEQQSHWRLVAEEKLSAALTDLQVEALRNAELNGRASAVESALVQRQEELSQFWDQLLAAEKAAGAAEALAAQERERRLDGEQRLLAAESGLVELRASLDQAHAQPAPVPDHLYAEIAQLTRMLQEQEAVAQSADTARSAAEQELALRSEENGQLKARLQQQEAAGQAAEAARVATEQKLAARFDEIARITAMLADESDRASTSAADADWLREMMQVAERLPKWWGVMPSTWRRQREHARYLRAGLFDARAYLDIYPDVAAHGMDPVRHYILHGMGEGRKRPQ